MRHVSNQKCFGHCLRLFSSLPAMKEPAQNVRREKGRQQRQHLLRMIRSQQSSALPACAKGLRASQRALGARKRVPPWNSTVPHVNGCKSKEAGEARAVRKGAQAAHVQGVRTLEVQHTHFASHGRIVARLGARFRETFQTCANLSETFLPAFSLHPPRALPNTVLVGSCTLTPPAHTLRFDVRSYFVHISQYIFG